MINLQNLFRKNLPVKILALIASIIMWGYVMNEENPSVNGRYTVPVEIINAPEGYDVNNYPGEQIQRSDIFSFAGNYLSFLGTFCLGYFIFLQDETRRIDDRRSKVAEYLSFRIEALRPVI